MSLCNNVLQKYYRLDILLLLSVMQAAYVYVMPSDICDVLPR